MVSKLLIDINTNVGSLMMYILRLYRIVGVVIAAAGREVSSG